MHGAAWATPPPPAPAVAARPYLTRLPAGHEPSSPAPLLLLLHGYGDAAASFAGAVGELLPGAIVVAPDGTPDRRGLRFWNAASACCDFDGSGPDDVAYLDAVIADARARHRVDPRRIFVLGFSNGGFMAHRLACASRQPIAALASIGGSACDSRCDRAAPRALVEIHGIDDRIVPAAGGSVGGGLPKAGVLPSSRAGIAAWAKAIGCAPEPEPASAGISRWRCPRGAAELHLIAGGHQASAEAFAAAAAFLVAHPAP